MRISVDTKNIFLWFFLSLFLFIYAHQDTSWCPSAVSRLDLLRAITIHGTVKIDAYHHNTGDKATYGGHFYSDKAPGTAAVALPAFWLGLKAVNGLGIGNENEFEWLFTSWVACSGSIAVIAAFGNVALFLWLKRRVPQRIALLTSAGIFLGATVLPYNTMLFSHSMVVGCIAIAIWALDSRKPDEPAIEMNSGESFLSRQKMRDIIAGFCLGLALASEYTSGIIVIGIALGMLWRQVGRMIWVFIGAIPALLLIPLYSWLCLGNPFTLPYSYNESYPDMKEGLYAIKYPDPETAVNLLFSPARGLLFWTPFFALSAIGYYIIFKESWRNIFIYYILPLVQLIVISGRVWDWQAGPTMGPRYLAPMLPLLALPCAIGLMKYKNAGLVLLIISIALSTLGTLTNACPNYRDHPNPLIDLHIPLLIKGEFAPNLGMLVGLSPYASIYLYYFVLICGLWWLWRRLPGDDKPPAKPEEVTG